MTALGYGRNIPSEFMFSELPQITELSGPRLITSSPLVLRITALRVLEIPS
jgi:hypothetical protein